MKRVQSVLGEHQDSVIAREVARDLGIAAHLAGENAFSYGLLYEQDACDAERLQAEARQVWKKASRQSPGWPGYTQARTPRRPAHGSRPYPGCAPRGSLAPRERSVIR